MSKASTKIMVEVAAVFLVAVNSTLIEWVPLIKSYFLKTILLGFKEEVYISTL